MGYAHLFEANASTATEQPKIKSTLKQAYGRIERMHEAGRLSLESGISKIFGESPKDPTVKACRDASLAIAAKVDSGQDGSSKNAYHNPMHFAKVAMNFMELAQGHNKTCAPNDRLSSADMATGVLAALSHDLGHNGKGNMVDGTHKPFHLEQQSIDIAKGWTADSLKSAPEAQKAFSLIYATDVSGNPSPAHVVRTWHDYYFKNAPKPDIKTTPKELIPVVGDRKTTLMASLLQDADVLHSVLSCSQNAKESLYVAEEAKMTMSAAGSQFFLKNLVGGRMTTDVARNVADGFIKGQMSRNDKTMAKEAAAKAAQEAKAAKDAKQQTNRGLRLATCAM